MKIIKAKDLKVKCFYHSIDADGFLSAAIVLKKHPGCKLLPANHGDKFDISNIDDGDTVYVVDFCLPIDLMEELDSRCNLIWIDHHKTSIEDAKKAKLNPDGIRVDGKAACELTWEYCFPDIKIPWGVKMIGRYDVWDLKDPDNINFQYGIKSEKIEPDSGFWDVVFNDNEEDIQEIIDLGENNLKFLKSEDERYCKDYSFETELDGHKAICANSGFKNSMLYESVWDNKKYDIMITFCWKPSIKKWTVSLYSDKNNIDCSTICKKFSGGGHKGAAGFTCEKLPFDL